MHEFLHLGSPLMRDEGPWLNEGIATFYEPVLRARAGWKTEDEVWREWISQMPRGMPAMTEIGLSNAGRGGIYWGGAVVRADGGDRPAPGEPRQIRIQRLPAPGPRRRRRRDDEVADDAAVAKL